MPAEPVKSISDPKLIESLKKGNRSSFAKLYDLYSAPLFGMILGMTQDLKLAEDILQQTFILTWENRNDHDQSNQRFFTWMLCIARNLAKESNKIPEININSKIHNQPDSVSDNIVLTMICLKGYSVEMAAKELNIPEQQIRIMFKNELHHYKTIIS